MNTDIQGLRADLQKQYDALNTLLTTTQDPDAAQTIVTEMGEILHRIDLATNLLLIQTTDELKTALGDVTTQSAVLTAALKKSQSAQNIITSVSRYLGYVDTAIDLAKLV
jgi:hypothetical protein